MSNQKLDKGDVVFMYQGDRNDLKKHIIASVGPKWMTLVGIPKHVKFSVIDGSPAPDVPQPYSYNSCML
jgi:hypothetical protein